MENWDSRGCVPLVAVTRGEDLDLLHRGSFCMTDAGGHVLMAAGNPASGAFIRSAAKPIQCIPVIASGAAGAFGLDDADIAIICGSHGGGDAQAAQVSSLLAKCGLGPDELQCGDGVRDMCSGKHAGMLAVCRHKDYPIGNYLDPEHPLQREIVATLAEVCVLNPDEIRLAVDGCSAPTPFFSLRNMARGYARMSVPESQFTGAVQSAVERIQAAMESNAGGHTGEPDYRRALKDLRLMTKGGANGIFCAGLTGLGLGFALKVGDGSPLPRLPVFTEVLRRMGIVSETEAEEMARSFWPSVSTRRGQAAGRVVAIF